MGMSCSSWPAARREIITAQRNAWFDRALWRITSMAAQVNADNYAKAERLDGCYLIKTDRNDLSGDELWRVYSLLTRAENAFRDMKSPSGRHSG
jgi:hypothetical protein